MAQQKVKKSYEIDMVNGPLFGKLLLFSIPLIFSGVLQLVFNAADVIVVGQFAGPNSIAAVGSTSSIINLLISVFMGLAVGVNVLAARYFAQRQEKDMEETVATAVAFSLVGGVVLAVIGIVLARPILELTGSPEDVIDLSELYMRIYFAGMPVQLLYNFGAAVLRAVGDTKRPLYFLSLAGIINVVLNLIFVIVLHMDVAGVALATISAQAISAALVLRCLVQTDQMYRLDLRRIRFVGEKFLKIVQIGLPAGVQGAVFSFSNTVIQSSVNSFGSTVMAGNAAAQNLEAFVYQAMNAMYQACIAFVSANYGVHKFDRINRTLVDCLAIVTVIGLVMGNAFYYFGHPLLSIYTSDAQTIQYGLTRMSIICTTYFLCGVMDVLCGAIRGLGTSIIPMIVSLLGACGFRLLWIATVFRANHTQKTLYISYTISWALTASVHLLCYIVIYRKTRKAAGQAAGA